MNVHQLNLDLCKALKIDTEGVTEVTLQIKHGDLPTVTTRRLVKTADGLAAVVEVLQLKPTPAP